MEFLKDKKLLRKEVLDRRKDIDKKEKEKMDEIIEEKLYESSYYKNAKNIFIYISYDSEINTRNIINNSLKAGKKIYVPRTEFKTKLMDAVEVTTLDNLTKSSYGILEPSIEESAIDPNELDLIIVPGVAFDESHGRMGYGAGFYDRYFKRINEKSLKKITKLAMAYDFQVINKVPMDKDDVPVDCIFTEKRVI
ncbi:5-formyltetrahydrofolate cyclo-ligase [Clostridium saccharobutylicum]|uniref:5-formyltetrahydrofolate cyclo-ligase n=1 Tax=Clostridium saccharobutylicum DSM 13864 TaxID=1345695 RepID=U5MLK1_CLOSA|nr:5-formyltetrahydrofolate cyclo-ligase [Clostridium saccharobutylicum]AGX41373.1 5-formyltetrahydrofolate cyclo-ligase [Clostridium saccharobutylicum DSM 13864]AQR88654.1 putative 5-formyltetrahydrofolate cyclo-ligase [Clostridium saccharobutylicum]AQR98552.1 putative 5-formyltetrahydrofolate cyclo-ligase [Clostridium saccharobutylicum]AQS12542.1 putative 5-formyltetrahydrofolate cyclo-ligase [Clostridium saccharobutylicum]MBA2905561.1 5-formyltetrahydrofolate cyclo-ligase [Clostridium sacch